MASTTSPPETNTITVAACFQGFAGGPVVVVRPGACVVVVVVRAGAGVVVVVSGAGAGVVVVNDPYDPAEPADPTAG